MFRQIRSLLHEGDEMLGGGNTPLEVDETYMGILVAQQSSTVPETPRRSVEEVAASNDR